MSDPIFVDPALPSVPARDMLADFLAFAELVKTIDPVVQKAKELRELEIRVAVERENLADAKAERGDLEARAAMLDRRDAELGLRERSQNAKFDDARRELVAQHRKLVEIESAIKLRLLRHAGALAGFNAAIQSVPSWDAIDRLAGGPVDVIEEMRPPSMATTRESWGGDKLSDQSTLTRSVPMAAMASHDEQPTPPPVRHKPPARRGYRAAMRRAIETP